MKLAKLLILLTLVALVLPGCARHHRMHHHGYRGGDAAIERAKQDVSALVDKSIQDSQKAEQAKATMENIVAEARQSRQQNRQFHEQLYELNANYAATPEEFLKILDEMNSRRMQSATKILRLRFDMKELMTEEEWKALTDGMAEMRGRYRHRYGDRGKKEGSAE